jgi:predicted enzyme related to lactoylglutathione lyase
MSRVVHFEIPATNIEAVKTFYTNVFNWNFSKWEGPDPYWLVSTGEKGTPGIDGGLYTPGRGMSGTINTLDVDNLDKMLAKVLANGGQVVAPKMELPGIGWLAYAKDPEGTVFGLMQSLPNAMM